MPHNAKVYDVLIACPPDSNEEHRAITRALYDWNSVNARQRSVMLMCIEWNAHPVSAGTKGTHAQDATNRTLLTEADIYIALFRQKCGVSTGAYDSRITEEIEEFRRLDRPLLLYVYDREPSKPEDRRGVIDYMFPGSYRNRRESLESYVRQVDEYRKMKAVCHEYEQQGMVGRYRTFADITNAVGQHITTVLDRLCPE